MTLPRAAALILIPALVACAPSAPEPVRGPAAAMPQMPPLDPALGPIRLAEQACLRAVGAAAGTPQVMILNGDFAPDGTVYQITTGTDVWRCTGYGDGTASDVAPVG